MFCVQCRAISAGLGALSAGAYAAGGHWGRAGRQLRSTAVGVALGGFGGYRGVTRASRYCNRATRGWRGGMKGYVKRSRSYYARGNYRYRFHSYSAHGFTGGGFHITKYEQIHYNRPWRRWF